MQSEHRGGTRRRTIATVVVIATLVALPSTSRAQSAAMQAAPQSATPFASPLRRRPHFSIPWFSAAAATGVTAIALGFAIGPRPTPNFVGGWLFDDAVRQALRASSPDARRLAGTISDGFLYTMMAAPFVQAAVGGLWLRRDPLLAAHMALIDAEAYAVSYAALWLFKTFAGRERPYVTADHQSANCLPGSTSPLCHEEDTQSFLSGHSAMSFTAAGLMCSHGLSMHLLGGAADATTCGVALAAAATTATLRVVSDNHYATDVLAGSAMGLLSGLAMPLFFHYRVPSPSADSTARHPSSNPLRAFGVVPMVAPGGFGLSVSAVTF